MKKMYFWKRKSTKLIMAVALFLTVLCVIQLLRPNREYCFEGEMLFQEGRLAGDYPVYEGIRLSPGVYYVELAYSCDTDLQNVCYAQDGTVMRQSLLTHGTPVYSGLSAAAFHMWLFEHTDALQILIRYSGQGDMRVGNLHIYETNQLWTMCLVGIIFFTVLVMAAHFLRLYDKTYPISGENKNVMFALLVVMVISSIPYLTGAVTDGADLGYHLQRIEGIKDGILSGQFPVRLEPRWVNGYGYANGIFYCGTLLLFPALLRMAGFPVTFSYNCYCIALNIATVLVSFYSFSKIFRSRYIGAAGSALYSMSIFRIYKLLVTSAVGEGSAITFMPLIVYGFWRVFAEDRHDRRYRTSWIPLAFGYAGLIQTHVLSCEIAALITGFVCIVFIKKILCRERFWELCKGALGALTLSLWFLIPFLDYYLREDLHIKHVWARTIQERGLYLAQLMFNWWRCGDNALIGETGMVHSHALGVGFVLAAGFLVIGVLWFSGRLKDTDEPVWKLAKTAWVLGGMLMLMSLELFPWDKIQNSSRFAAALVSSLQFPNRFLGWGSVFLVVLFCSLLYYFKDKKQDILYFTGFLCVLVSIATSGMYLYDHVCQSQSQSILYNPEGMGAGYISGAEYLVEGTEEEKLLYREPVVSDGVQISGYEKGELRAEFSCDNTGEREGYVDLPLLHYYGYRAIAVDEGAELQVYKGDNNVVRVIIPPECHMQVAVSFVSPWYWRIAEVISLTGGIWIMANCLFHCVYLKEDRKKGIFEGKGNSDEKISGRT